MPIPDPCVGNWGGVDTAELGAGYAGLDTSSSFLVRGYPITVKTDWDLFVNYSTPNWGAYPECFYKYYQYIFQRMICFVICLSVDNEPYRTVLYEFASEINRIEFPEGEYTFKVPLPDDLTLGHHALYLKFFAIGNYTRHEWCKRIEGWSVIGTTATFGYHESKVILIEGNITDGLPAADFEYIQHQDMAPAYVEFTDKSYSYFPILSWHWFFGDGEESDRQNPVHTYHMPGDYHVLLSVKNDFGADTIEGLIQVSESPPRPVISATSYWPQTVYTGALIEPRIMVKNQGSGGVLYLSYMLRGKYGFIGSMFVPGYSEDILWPVPTQTIEDWAGEDIISDEYVPIIFYLGTEEDRKIFEKKFYFSILTEEDGDGPQDGFKLSPMIGIAVPFVLIGFYLVYRGVTK